MARSPAFRRWFSISPKAPLGLPVFSPAGPGGIAHLLGPNAGFLFAYPLAAAAAGWIVRSMPRFVSRFSSAILAGIGSSVITFALGAGWLAHLLHLGSAAVWSLAVAPVPRGRSRQDHRRRRNLQHAAEVAAVLIPQP